MLLWNRYIDGECEQLKMLIEELLEVTNRLSSKYKVEKDIKIMINLVQK